MFFRKHLSKDELIAICKMFANKMSYRAVARTTNRHLDTIRDVGHKISNNFHKFQDYFHKDLRLSRKETRAMRAHLKKKNARVKDVKKTTA